MTNDASMAICRFCYVAECDGIDDTVATKLRRQVQQREPVTLPECPLVCAYVFNYHDTTAAWCQDSGNDSRHMPGRLRRYVGQMVERYDFQLNVTRDANAPVN